jgi:hypothetical protein
MLAVIPKGESPFDRNSPVTVVVISSGEKGDQLVGSLEVKAPVAGRTLVRSAQGPRSVDNIPPIFASV